MPAASAPPASREVVILVEHVDKWFGAFRALTDACLTVHRGERIVICGPSGSGKSTLIRCINQLSATKPVASLSSHRAHP